MNYSNLSICVPAYNEQEAVVKTLKRLKRNFPQAEILFVDDGSTDNTLAEASAVDGVRVLAHDRNIGYGAAIKTAIRNSTRKVVAWYDADGQHRAQDLEKVVQPVLDGEKDAVIGARTRTSAITRNRLPGKWILRFIAELIVRNKIPDLNSGLRCFRREVIIRYLHLLPDGFSASTTSTILMMKRGYRIGYEDITLEQLDRSGFPAADWFDYSSIRAQCESLAEQGYVVCFGTAGDMDFINGISRARGMEQVLIDLYTDDPVYLEIMNARFQFYYDMHERVLQAAGGLVDVAHTGEDLGNQRGPMIGMDIFERHFADKLKAYFDMVHKYGAKSMMHMCGCVEPFLPRLIELGLDIMDVVQPTTPEMDIAYLNEHYGDRLTFCGSLCVQTTLPHGTVEDVEKEVQRRLDLFPDGGLILGPTHAVQVGTPIENILAMYRRAGSLTEEPDESIMNIQTEADRTKVNMSKLF